MTTIKIHYETAQGLENPRLTKIKREEKQDISSHLFGFDYVLRGEVEGWPTRDFQLTRGELTHLNKDINIAINGPIFFIEWGEVEEESVTVYLHKANKPGEPDLGSSPDGDTVIDEETISFNSQDDTQLFEIREKAEQRLLARNRLTKSAVTKILRPL